ncbi:claudin-1 [Oncorhynchus mykiss]|uniref:Claudin n=1 Tax=Oncorhynchus mykiss TaxID=8022 RepID=A0A8C7P3W8_ONCMY|nr:claudin-1 [Oncorhynchus mykiss]
MTSSAVQLPGYALALIGLVGSVIATTMVEWKRHSYTESTVTSKETYLGLWMSCTVDATRHTMCVNYKSLFHLPAEILTTRVVMILSVLLSAIGVLVATLGMRCTRCLEEDEKQKDRVAIVGGFLFIIAGVLAISVTSWFANAIIRSFVFSDSPTSLHNRFEFGNAVLVSWGAGICSVVGGFLLGCRYLWSCPQGSRSVSSFTQPKVIPGTRPGTHYV